MGFLDFLRFKGTKAEPANGPSSDALRQVEEFNESSHRTSIVRDYGMQSRTVREALEVLSEAAPTMPGLSLLRDQQGFRSMNRSIRDRKEAARQNIMIRCETSSVINPIADRGLDIRT